MNTSSRIELFGGLKLHSNNDSLSRLPSQKAGVLLAYLALSSGKPQPREHLIDLLWPDLELDAGRNNLSTLLSLLRRALEPKPTPVGSVLLADRQAITLNPLGVTTDVGEFEALLQRASRATDTETRLSLLTQAAALVTGELLPGLYEDWVLKARSRYAELHTKTLRQTAHLLLDLGRGEEAQENASLALQLDACDSEACELSMKAVASLGKPELSLQAFARLEKALLSDLGVKPDAKTQALSERIRREPETFLLSPEKGEGLPSPQHVFAKTPSLALPSDAHAPQTSDFFQEEKDKEEVASRLPLPLTRFFGREQECADLNALLCNPTTRLVTLLGAGGTGKTRLAMEMARQIAPHYRGRLWFISLADIPSSSLIPMLLLAALELPSPQGDPMDAIVASLSKAPSVLVLDNMEHLLTDEETKAENPRWMGARSTIRRLLERVPGLVCLVTSRQSLNLEGEQEYALPPLAIPANNTLAHLQDCASVALYVDRAQKAKADFVLTAHNAEAIATLCRRLEGMPLALEMASAWIKTLPPARMLERLEHQLDILVSRRRDLPARQQSLRATCEWSYEQLPLRLQRAFSTLSVFRGGWSLEGAEALIGKDALHTLTELQGRSLVIGTEGDEESRYRLLEPLREFGLEKLAEDCRSESVSQLHTNHFFALSEKARQGYRTDTETQWIATLKREQENLRTALDWCRQKDEWTGLSLAANLARFWELDGNLIEGHHWLVMMLSLSTVQKPTQVRGDALQGAGGLAMLMTDYAQAETHYTEALQIFESCGYQKGCADVLHGLGNIAFYEQRFEGARSNFERSLQIRAQIGDEPGIASSYHSLGNLEMTTGYLERAESRMKQAVSLRRRLKEEIGVAYSLGALGQLSFNQERYEVALDYYREILQTFHRVGVRWAVALTLRNMSRVFWRQGRLFASVTLLGAVQTLREETGYLIPPAEHAAYAEELQMMRTAIGDAEFEKAWSEGTVMQEPIAVKYALQLAEFSCFA